MGINSRQVDDVRLPARDQFLQLVNRRIAGAQNLIQPQVRLHQLALRTEGIHVSDLAGRALNHHQLLRDSRGGVGAICTAYVTNDDDRRGALVRRAGKEQELPGENPQLPADFLVRAGVGNLDFHHAGFGDLGQFGVVDAELGQRLKGAARDRRRSAWIA